MSQSFKVIFLLKKSNSEKSSLRPIYVRVTTNGQRAEWSIQRNCHPAKWNTKTGRLTGNKEETKELNAYLDAILANIFALQKEYALKNQIVSAEEIRSRVLHKQKDRQHSLFEVFQYHNDQFEKLVGKEFSCGTFKKFKSALKSLKEFVNWQFKRTDIPLTAINHKFITDYEFYLKSVRNLQHNSAMGNVKKLKKIIRLSVANDWLDKDPFRAYKITTKETHRNFLLQNELDILRDKKILLPRLQQVKDIFLFSCYTGLSYSDLMKLTITDISIGIDGEEWIFTKRIKTGTDSRIPLLPPAKNILAKYESHPQVINSGKLFPQLSNQRLNSYLKEIADICNFNKELTFHCARHTFATTVTLSNGIPIETVSKMLGHNSLRTTQRYAKILDRKVSDDMQKLRVMLSNKCEKGLNETVLNC